MTHRFDLQRNDELTTILFQGRLDRKALSKLEALCLSQKQRGEQVCVRLGAGTRVEAKTIEELVSLGDIAIEADSPFLTLWIQNCQKNTER